MLWLLEDILEKIFLLDSDSITPNPSQNREVPNTNVQSYSFKMLQRALEEGSRVSFQSKEGNCVF